MIEHYRHLLSSYFLLILSSCRIDLMISGGNWLKKPAIISYFSSTVRPILDHHQDCVYCKRDVTFAFTLLLCKNEHLYWCIL